MKRLSVLHWIYIGANVLVFVVCLLEYGTIAAHANGSTFEISAFWLAIAAYLCSAFVQTVTADPRRYFTFLLFQVLAALALEAEIFGLTGVEDIAFGTVTVGICLFNPFAINLILSVVTNVLIVLTRSLVFSWRHVPAAVVAASQIDYAVLAVVIILFASLVTYYREQLARVLAENERMDGLIDRLARANLNYQTYATTIEAVSAESERKRITRDIHDIVGYTLTNNITIMEAITDMIRMNLLGVRHLVDSARENAEEGLSRVRKALHLLRDTETTFPKGYAEVRRIAVVFQKATGVEVTFAFSDARWEFCDEADQVMNHVVQESLVNSFRHGKATKIVITLSRDRHGTRLTSNDNGVGSDEVSEGIGLAGMRERIQKLGGTIQAGPVEGGFEVVAVLPEKE